MKLLKRNKKRKKKFFMPNKYMDVIDKIFDLCGEYDITPEELMYIIERVKMFHIQFSIEQNTMVEKIEELRHMVRENNEINTKFPPLPKKDVGVG